MTYARCVFAIVAAIAAQLAAPHHAAAQTPVPRAVMQQLAVQLRKDVPAVRDCDSKKEFPFTARTLDLNGDKLVEYLLTSANDCECGQVNCAQWVYRSHNGQLEFLMQGEGYVLNVRNSSHKSYRDLETTSRDNAAIVDHNTYAFNGSRYERIESRIENLDTHESKLTLQRIHFAPGTSSATVSGTAAVAFSDSWVLDAKKGQTLQLNVARVSGRQATLTLLGPGKDGDHVMVDAQSAWTGKLPENGTYTILVDTKGDGRAAYRLTVSIP